MTILFRVRNKPSLIREIATPHIPTYATALLALASPESGVLTVKALLIALPAFHDLICNFPNTFRPFVTKLMNSIVYPVLNSSTWTGTAVESEVESWCRKIYSSIYLTFPKDQLREWQIAFIKVIGEAHKTISQIFDCVIEESSYTEIPLGWDLSVNAQSRYNSVLRLEMLFRLLQSILSTETKRPVQVPLSKIVELADRVLDINTDDVAFIETSERQDRDFILTILPVVHGNTYSLLNAVVNAVGQSMLPHTERVFSHLKYFKLTPSRYAISKPVSSFSSNYFSSPFTIPMFEFLTSYLLTMRIVPEDFTQEITHVIDIALESVKTIQDSSTLADFVSHASAFISQPPSELKIPVVNLLHAVIVTMPDLPASSRSSIDRFALLLHNNVTSEEEKLLIAAVLQPGNSIRWSILPMVSRKIPASELLGGLIHPRFPPMPKRKEEIEATASTTTLKLLQDLIKRDAADEERDGNDEEMEDAEISSNASFDDKATTKPSGFVEDIAVISQEVSGIETKTDSQKQPTPEAEIGEPITAPDIPETIATSTPGLPKRAAEVETEEKLYAKRPKSDDDDEVSEIVASTAGKAVVERPNEDRDAESGMPVERNASEQEADVTDDEYGEDEDFEIPELNTEASSDDDE